MANFTTLIHPGHLIRFDSDLSRHTMRDTLVIPNGITWSPDQKIMYFVHSTERIVYAYDYFPSTGSISNPRPFWKLATSSEPDGFEIDKDGFLWQAIYGDGKVVRISPEGKVVGEILLPTRAITCCTFVGEDLFITTASEGEPEKYPESAKYGGALFKVNVGTTGLANFKFKLNEGLVAL
jgi:sugar lactone lactonase YvrE